MSSQFIRKSYSSLGDYDRNYAHIDVNSNFDSVCPLDLVRQCISLADFCGHKVSARGIGLFVEFIDFALAPSSDGFLKCTDDYRQQEPTVKTAITTIVGLASAKYIAEKDRGIRRLLHCKEMNNYFQMDDCIYSVSDSRFIPDFFGINANDEGCLFEAKGSGIPLNSTTGNSRKSTGRIRHAIEDQLKAIGGIRTPSKSYIIGKNKSYVVESGFRDSIFMISDIDPSSQGSISMLLNPAEAYISYYSALLADQTASANSSPVKIEGTEYVVFPIPGTEYSMGVVKDLPSAVRRLAEAYEPFQETVSKVIDRHGFGGANVTPSRRLSESRKKASLTAINRPESNEAAFTEISSRALMKTTKNDSYELAQSPILDRKTLEKSLVPIMPADAYGYIAEAYQSTIQKYVLIEEIDQITTEIEPATTKDYSIGPDGFALFKGV